MTHTIWALSLKIFLYQRDIISAIFLTKIYNQDIIAATVSFIGLLAVIVAGFTPLSSFIDSSLLFICILAVEALLLFGKTRRFNGRFSRNRPGKETLQHNFTSSVYHHHHCGV